MQCVIIKEITGLLAWRFLCISLLNRRHALDSALKPVQTFSMICIKMQSRPNNQYFQGLDL